MKWQHRKQQQNKASEMKTGVSELYVEIEAE
jgi:hypothetical protein